MSLSRRQVLKRAALIGATAAAAGPARAFATIGGPGLAARAAATAPAGSDLGAVEHIVFLMLENRSYDHYFGAYPKGRGFDDHPPHSLGPFAQPFPGAANLSPPNVLLPFRLPPGPLGQCTDDLTHDWVPMHECWNRGRMDWFVRTHTKPEHEGDHGALTMGYYTRDELPFYWALADAFTLCDGYFSSVLGSTHPNRLMSLSGTIDPAGTHGGPIVHTTFSPDAKWTCSWPTLPELLEDAGVSWKVYHPSFVGATGDAAVLASYPIWNPALYDPAGPEVMLTSNHTLTYFKQFQNRLTPLYAKAFGPTFPADFIGDINTNSLPSVSWIIPPLGFDEHPSASPDHGMFFTSMILRALLANPAVWAKTALFVMYDENDGFFDHVPPPTPPTGTAGEYVTARDPSAGAPRETDIVNGPIGLGVRVPALVLSPFSRGGHIASEVFDHTSQLKLIAERFGVAVPGISAWRNGVVGDLTSALFRGPGDTSVPALPAAPLGPLALSGACNEVGQESELQGVGPSVPARQGMPTQQGTVVDAAYYFGAAANNPNATGLTPTGPGKATAKSSANALAHGHGLAKTGRDDDLRAAAAILAAGIMARVVTNRGVHPG